MKLFTKKIGENGAEAIFYLQEPSPEIQEGKKFPVVVNVPGGAFLWTSVREGDQMAMEYLGRGFSSVVVNYATEGRPFYKENTDPEKLPNSIFPNSLVEVAKTVAMLRENADEWAIDSNAIVVAGYSAGGTVTGQLSVYWNEPWLAEKVGYPSEMLRPNAAILAYPMLDCVRASDRSQINAWMNRAVCGNEVTQDKLTALSPLFHVNKDVPQTFLWHTMEDSFVPVSNTLEYVMKLQENNVPCEVHIYQKGEHGFALGDKRTDAMPDHSQVNEQGATWVDLSIGWMKQIGIADLK